MTIRQLHSAALKPLCTYMQITVISLGMLTDSYAAGQHSEAVCTPHWVVVLLNVSDSCREWHRSSAYIQQRFIQKQHAQAARRNGLQVSTAAAVQNTAVAESIMKYMHCQQKKGAQNASMQLVAMLCLIDYAF